MWECKLWVVEDALVDEWILGNWNSEVLAFDDSALVMVDDPLFVIILRQGFNCEGEFFPQLVDPSLCSLGVVWMRRIRLGQCFYVDLGAGTILWILD